MFIKYSQVCEYPHVPMDFKKIHEYFLSGYPTSKQMDNW